MTDVLGEAREQVLAGGRGLDHDQLVRCLRLPADRLAAEPELDRTKEDLMRLEEADILASPLFSLAESISAVEESARRL